jgi:hypothetical protein
MAFGQEKNNIFLDLGCNTLGISGTFDRRLSKHFELGAGLNYYDYAFENDKNLRTAAYVDLRPYWSIGRSLLFVNGNVGLAILGGLDPHPDYTEFVTWYTALGVGYCYRINKRGLGPYLSLTLNGYHRHIHMPNSTSPDRDYYVVEGSSVLSIGFKF